MQYYYDAYNDVTYILQDTDIVALKGDIKVIVA